MTDTAITKREPNKLDIAEAKMLEYDTVPLPLFHRFTPGLYIREIHIPAGIAASTRRHKQEHPFVILEGNGWIVSEDEIPQEYVAPYFGITPKGTRRIVIAETDTRWITFHATDLVDPDQIGEELTESSGNPLIENHDDPKVNLWRTTNTLSTVCHMPQLEAAHNTGDIV